MLLRVYGSFEIGKWQKESCPGDNHPSSSCIITLCSSKDYQVFPPTHACVNGMCMYASTVACVWAQVCVDACVARGGPRLMLGIFFSCFSPC